MPITPSYNPDPVQPELKIYNVSGSEQYSYTSADLNASATRDFNLRYLNLHVGTDDDVGSLVVVIDDNDRNLINSTGDPIIQEQWGIRLRLGKTTALLSNWFHGKIVEIESVSPDSNLHQLRLLCAGWGVRLKERITNISRHADKQSNGLDIDYTDVDAYTSEMAKDLFQDTDHLVDQDIGSESNLTVNGVDTDNATNVMSDFHQYFQSWSGAMSHLATCAGVHYGVDADRDVYFRFPEGNNTGLLFTNDLSSTVAQNWDSTKIGYLLRDQPVGWRASTMDTGYSWMHGINVHAIIKDQENTSCKLVCNSNHTIDRQHSKGCIGNGKDWKPSKR